MKATIIYESKAGASVIKTCPPENVDKELTRLASRGLKAEATVNNSLVAYTERGEDDDGKEWWYVCGADPANVSRQGRREETI
jgi:hypothetical protein